MTKLILAMFGAMLVAGCSTAPIQKVESNSTCDYALMQRIQDAPKPTLNQLYWVNCPQVHRVSGKPSS